MNGLYEDERTFHRQCSEISTIHRHSLQGIKRQRRIPEDGIYFDILTIILQDAFPSMVRDKNRADEIEGKVERGAAWSRLGVVFQMCRI
jgi:hypothetical protein